MVVAMVAVRIMADLITAGYPGSVTVEVGDRPYYSPRGWLLCRPHLLRLEARTLGMRGTASESGSTAITSCEEDIERAALLLGD